jgi:hypothetical protein
MPSPPAYNRGNYLRFPFYSNWILRTLSFFEQDNIRKQWIELFPADPAFQADFDKNLTGPTAPGAQSIKTLICPSDAGTREPAIDAQSDLPGSRGPQNCRCRRHGKTKTASPYPM